MIRFEKRPDGSLDTGRLTEWAATCTCCGRKCSVTKLEGWLFARAGCAAVYCPRCIRRTSRKLVRSAGRIDPVRWLIGWVRSRDGRRADLAYDEDPFT